MLRALLLLLATVCASFALGYHYIGATDGVTWISVGAACYAAGQLMLVNNIPVGHGVNGTRHFLGMPILMFGFYMLILMIILFFGMTNEPSLQPATNTNFFVLGMSVLFGWLAALFDWNFFSYRETYYASEQAEREAMQRSGVPPKEVERTIEKLRATGYLPKKKPRNQKS